MKIIYPFIIGILLLSVTTAISAQEWVSGGMFNDRRVINAHSVEILPAKKLDLRISHRFGDIAGEQGGFKTFYGLENASDILIGFEYGLSDKANVGVFRTKGAGIYTNSKGASVSGLRQVMSGTIKYRLMNQNNDKALSIVILGVGSISTQAKTPNDLGTVTSFPSFSDRMAGTVQILLARKFSDALSLQLSPAYTHRNFVSVYDENGILSVGLQGRLRISKVLGLLVDITSPISSTRTADDGYSPSVGFGLDIDTGGHVFQINVTNSKGLIETDYIPYTNNQWSDGEFRLGFTISRIFNL